MQAKGGSRARGRRPGAVAVAVSITAGLLGLAGAPALAAPAVISTPAPTASIADGVALTVIVPITAPADAGGLLSSASLTEYTATAPLGMLTRQLDAVVGTGAVIAIDPMILASIRVLGSTAPASAREWLARFESAPNERFALPYADADPTLFTASSAGSLPSPLGFGFAIDPANFAAPVADPTPEPTPTTTPVTTPTPTPDPSAPPAVPTDDEVVAVPGAIDGIVWPRAGTATEADLGLLGGNALILSTTDVADAASIGGLGTLGDRPTMIASGEVADAMVNASRTLDEASWLAAVADARASIADAVAAQSGSAGVVVVALDRLDAANAARLPATLAELAADGTIRLTGLTELVEGAASAPAATLVPGAQDPERVATINTRLSGESAAAGFSTATANPALVTDPARLATLALGSQSWIGRTDWPTVVGESLAGIDALLASVRVVDATFQFFADRSVLPISIQNDGPQAVTLLVTAQPRTGLLDIDVESVELTVPAGSLATAEFAATAVSNGTVLVTVTMMSPTGVPIGAPAIADVNVQAGWETPIVAAAAVAVGVLLIFGIVRTIRRVRASRRAEETATDG